MHAYMDMGTGAKQELVEVRAELGAMEQVFAEKVPGYGGSKIPPPKMP